ncbi:MAG: class A beta-lactamase-related serine hydrolase [Candidatus Gottesmanbacteria bacterium]|nr:class A beta-lactamase-related serine hydrolase [Candidatus Gottesmanbacteria bacterium]
MKRYIFLAFCLLVSVGTNVYFFAQNLRSSEFEKSKKTFSYLSPRVLSDNNNDILIDFLPLRTKLHELTQDYDMTFAYQFEYLPTGNSLGLNEDVKFSAASLIKLPVVMAYYHQKERLKQSEDPTVTIAPDDIDKGYGDLWTKGAGAPVNLLDAVRLSLTASDNTAIMMIAHRVEKKDFDAVYEGLDIDFQQVGNEVIITVQQYAYILKSLYFSSVLTQKDSQAILTMLTQTDFRDKLVAGVPAGIMVAHKTGQLADQLFQDCGIVFLPKRPYILCMVSKSDEQSTARRMKDLSKTIYDYVSTVTNETKD